MTNSKNPTSLFIAIEGIDFSGKTTLVERLKQILPQDPLISKYFYRIIYTREPNPNCSDACGQIRKIAVENGQINDLTRALLFFANRSEHISKVVQPARDCERSLIICDRFYLSTLVYQIKKNEQLLKWAKLTQKMISPESPNWTYFIKINKNLFLSRYQENENRERNLLDKFTYERFDEISNLYEWFIQNKEDENIGEIKFLTCTDNNIEPIALKVQKDIQDYVKSLMGNK